MTRTYQYDADTFEDVERIIAGELVQIEAKFKNADYTSQMRGFLDQLNAAHAVRFDRDVSPAGEKWPPLSKVTIANKGHDTILEDTRAMKRSVTESGAPNAIRSATHRGLVFGTSDEKAIFHQYGTRKIPQRKFVGMETALLDHFVASIADATVEKMLT